MPVSPQKISLFLVVVTFFSFQIQAQVNAFVFSPSLLSRRHLSKATQLYKTKEDSSVSSSENVLSRREIIILGIGGTAYAKIVASAIPKIKRGDAYPPEHEDRVSRIFERTILEATSSASSSRPLRVLEVGIGDKCRTIVRGLYDGTLSSLTKMDNPPKIEMMGIDIDAPSDDVVKSANQHLSDKFPSLPISFSAMEGDIVQGLKMFPDGYFDAITSSLVLCSVSDQMEALKEIKRLLNPDGGTFGFIEHVAVNIENEEEKSLSFLELQQRVLDPLQQAVAHNCHLHRQTDAVISSAFGVDASEQATLLDTERFLCKEMWPVSLQCCGVVKVISK